MERPEQIPEQVWQWLPAFPFEYPGICGILPLPRVFLEKWCGAPPAGGTEPKLLDLTIPTARKGESLLASANIYLPRHPQGKGEAESGVPFEGVIEEPVYIVTFETEQQVETGWGAYPQQVLSARLDPGSLTNRDGIYTLVGDDGKGVPVWVPPGDYTVKGLIVAWTAWEEWKDEILTGYGTTTPMLFWKLGTVGKLKVS